MHDVHVRFTEMLAKARNSGRPVSFAIVHRPEPRLSHEQKGGAAASAPAIASRRAEARP